LHPGRLALHTLNIDGIEAYPDERQQQTEGNEADDRGKGAARNDGPAGHGQHQYGDPAIERENEWPFRTRLP
jgi:hypothetical protein